MKIKDRPEYKNKLAPFALRPHDVVPTAVKTMSEKNIGSVVVVDDAMQVKGIVTERDLLRRFLSMIQVQRQDFNGRMITIRAEDVRAIACLFGVPPDSMGSRLDELGLLVNV